MAGTEPWRGWAVTFLGASALLAAALFGFIAAMDPFGSRVAAGQAARPLMDLNQRYMYPQLVRSGAFDAALFGTSTMRLIDPTTLSQGQNGRFANLAMNAATPWEQTQIASLFSRRVPGAKTLIWGIDQTWCQEDATAPAKRLTERPFPPWLYDENRWNDWLPLFNLTILEIATRLLSNRLGLQPERIRGDGYEVFTPPDASYDLARARSHLFRAYGGRAPELTAIVPPETIAASIAAGWRFPALDWLEQALEGLPADTKRLVVLPPVHLSAMPREGSAAWQRFQACKAALIALAGRQSAALLDYAKASMVTREDENYWDPLHFRLAIARRVEADLAIVLQGGAPPADGVLQVTRPGR